MKSKHESDLHQSFKEKYFGIHTRGFKNLFLISLLLLIGIVLLGALGGPLAPVLFTGLMATLLALSILAGILTICTGILLASQKKVSHQKNLFRKFADWAKTHPFQLALGVLLCATLIILFGLLGGGISLPFLSVALGFIAKGLATTGFLMGIETSVLGLNILAGMGLSLTLFTGLDAICRVGNHCVLDKDKIEDLSDISTCTRVGKESNDKEDSDTSEAIVISAEDEVSEEDKSENDDNFFGRKY